MNYNAIDIDEEIAFVNQRSRGGPYPMHARKGLVLDKRKVKRWQNKSMTGQLLVEVPAESYDYRYGKTVTHETETEEIWIDAYVVIDFWDRYEQEREHLYGEQLRQMEKLEIERRDREAARLEQLRIKERATKDLKDKIEKGLSLPEGSVTILDQTVVINREILESRFREKVVN